VSDAPANAPGAGGEHWPYNTAARLLSLLLAGVLSGVMLIAPTLLVGENAGHGLLALLMWGIAAGFVHGVGYVPVHHVWQWLLGPVAGWVLMLGAGVVLLAQR
jgi:predicted membrane protein